MATVVSEHSPLGIARRQLADATEAAQGAAAALVPLETERDIAQARLAHLEALPVDLKKVDRERELEIASLRRGLVQLQQRIGSARIVADNAEKGRVVAQRTAGALQLRLNEVEHKLALLADLDYYETQNLTIRDHRFMLQREQNELLSITGNA